MGRRKERSEELKRLDIQIQGGTWFKERGRFVVNFSSQGASVLSFLP